MLEEMRGMLMFQGDKDKCGMFDDATISTPAIAAVLVEPGEIGIYFLIGP